MIAVITTNISALPQAHRIPFKISCHRRLVELPVSASHPHREKFCPGETLLRLPLMLDSRLRVNLQRGSAVGVAHQFLNDLYVLTIGNQKRGIAMPESMPPHRFADSSPQRSRSDDFLQNSIRPKRTSPIRVRARKYPVVCLSVFAGFFPKPDVGRYALIKRDWLTRRFRLAISNLS
jgi:hypothetical protein